MITPWALGARIRRRCYAIAAADVLIALIVAALAVAIVDDWPALSEGMKRVIGG